MLAACREDTYTLQMRVQPESVDRNLDVKSDPQGPVAQDDNKRLEAEVGPIRRIYAKVTTDKPGHAAFSGSFTSRTPDDIGGFGVVGRLKTTLGETVFYAERFRGSDDIVASNARRAAEVDRLVDTVVKWSREKFAGKPGADVLANILDTTIRADAQNLSMWMWMTGGAGAQAFLPDQPQSAADDRLNPMYPLELYLVEHGYVDAEDLLRKEPPTGRVSLPETPGEEWRALVQMVAHKLRQTGHADAAASLSDWGTAVALCDFVHRNLPLPSVGEDRVRDAADQSWQMLLAYVPTTVGLMLSNYDELHVKLDTRGEVVEHNGSQSAPGMVEWTLGMPATRADRSSRSPVVGAVSARPSEAAQRRALGGVLLTGDKLAEYCGLLHGLKNEQRDAWEQAMSGGGARADRAKLKAAAKKAGIDEDTTQRLLELVWMP
jgi:hypothetical protein